ncbi:MAG: hypothetical protein WBW81_07365 [Methylocella sp.]
MTQYQDIERNYHDHVEALAAAMGRLLGDLRNVRRDQTSQAQARIAYEPFAEDHEKPSLMPLDEARQILREIS